MRISDWSSDVCSSDLFAVPGRVNQRWLVGLAAVAIALSGAIGVYHAGVEYHWWAGATACTATFSGTGDDVLEQLMNAPRVRSDTAQWTLFGLSLAGLHALFSLSVAALIFVLLRPRRPRLWDLETDRSGTWVD